MAVGFTVTAFPLPTIFYYQTVRGLTPTQSALLMIPMAVISGALAPFVGKLIDRANPRYFAAFGLVCMAGALFWTAALLGPDTPIWMFLLPSALQGVANAFIWGPVVQRHHPQPGTTPGRCRVRCLQHHPPNRCGPGFSGHRCPDPVAALGGTARSPRWCSGGRSVHERRACRKPFTQDSRRR